MSIRISIVVVALAALAAPAHAIPRDSCPAGSVWSLAAGACVKKKAAPRLSPQEKFDRANDDIEGRGKNPDPKRGVTLLEQTCTIDKHPASCRLLGFLYARGRTVTKDDKRAADWYAKGCDLKDLESCVDVGDQAWRAGLYPNARRAFVLACNLGSGVACTRGGDLLERGIGGDTDVSGANAMYKKALEKLTPHCTGAGWNDGASCYMLGFIYEHGKATAKDAVKSLAAFKNGCTAGHGESCMQVGESLDVGFGGPVDKDGANKAFERACTDFDNSEACQKIAERLGMAKQDLPRAAKLAKRACELDPKWCGTLAEFYRLGFGVDAADQALATGYYKQACENGGLGWCENYGERAFSGVGMTADYDAAFVALDRACRAKYLSSCGLGARFSISKDNYDNANALAKIGCDADEGDSCFRLGWLVQNGKGTEQNLENGFASLEKACRLESPIGCNELAGAYNEGKGTAKDQAKAYVTFKKACDGNEKQLYAPACATQGRMAVFGEGIAKDLKVGFKALARACEFGEDVCQYLYTLNKDAGGKREDVEKPLAASCKSGHEHACVAHANMLLSSETETDKRAGYAKIVESCGRKHDDACLRQADLLADGWGVAKDVDKAAQMYRSRCDAGNNNACFGLARVAEAKNEHEEAQRLYQRTCEADMAVACNALGYRHYTAKGTRWDITAAAKLYQKTCDLGLLIGCSNLAETFRFGAGNPVDHKKAIELYEKACKPSDNIGCSGLGYYLSSGEGGAKVDKKRAEEVYRWSCEGEYGQPEACRGLADLIDARKGDDAEVARLRLKAFTRATETAKDNPYYMYVLGVFYAEGVATVKDPVKSREWLVKACEGFDPLGCIAAGKSLRMTGKAEDADRARVYFERACAAGVTDGCTLGKAKGPSAVGPAKGCCGGDVAPGAELGLAFVVLVIARRRRSRRRRH